MRALRNAKDLNFEDLRKRLISDMTEYYSKKAMPLNIVKISMEEFEGALDALSKINNETFIWIFRKTCIDAVFAISKNEDFSFNKAVWGSFTALMEKDEAETVETYIEASYEVEELPELIGTYLRRNAFIEIYDEREAETLKVIKTFWTIIGIDFYEKMKKYSDTIQITETWREIRATIRNLMPERQFELFKHYLGIQTSGQTWQYDQYDQAAINVAINNIKDREEVFGCCVHVIA